MTTCKTTKCLRPVVTGLTRRCSRGQLLDHLSKTNATAEIQCGTWAAFKMVKYLIRCTGDARYGDWVERLAINGIGATIPMTPGGNVYYYSDYNPHGGRKINNWTAWTCCTGTRIQATADVCDLTYFKDNDNLYVNLFTPSTVKWSHGGANITLHQTTRFPEDGTVEFTVETERPSLSGGPVEAGLKIRTPAWLAAPMTAKLNGQPVSLETDSLHSSSLRREWKSGDRLTVVLPMQLWVSRFNPKKDYPAAILHGPVVLAARACKPRLRREVQSQPSRSRVNPGGRRGADLATRRRSGHSVAALL